MEQGTIRLYWSDAYCFETAARIVAISTNAVALDRTCFFPGGGGQPSDEGWLQFANGSSYPVLKAAADATGLIWHTLATPLPFDLIGEQVKLTLDWQRRLTLMRHHTALHVLNTVTLREYGGWITGVQIGVAHSRIDFNLEGFSTMICADLATRVNAVLMEDRPVQASFISAAEFQQRPELLRTFDAKPPVIGGQVRVVEIVGFDVQACGGTHVQTTNAVGHFAIARTENKGKLNKRLYMHLKPTLSID